jgi:hypothetical protein
MPVPCIFPHYPKPNPTAGLRNIDPSPSPRTNENAWSLVDQLKMTYWGHRSVDILNDYLNVLELNPKARKVMMTILCDRGTHLLGVMATNITNNFACEVKPQQLRQFLNIHMCNLDNIDLFYQHYYKHVLMQQPADFLHLNLGAYYLEPIEKKRNWIQKWTKADRTFAERFVAFTAAMLIFDTVHSCAATSATLSTTNSSSTPPPRYQSIKLYAMLPNMNSIMLPPSPLMKTVS